MIRRHRFDRHRCSSSLRCSPLVPAVFGKNDHLIGTMFDTHPAATALNAAAEPSARRAVVRPSRPPQRRPVPGTPLTDSSAGSALAPANKLAKS